MLNEYSRIYTEYSNKEKNIIISDYARLYNVDMDGPNSIGRFCHISNTELGKYTYCASNCNIFNSTIGNYCSIGPNVNIGFGTHPTFFKSTHPIFYAVNNPLGLRHVNKNLFNQKEPVEIKHDVWLGANAIINNGVKIDIGAIIGANSFVNKDVGPYEIWAGNPAKFIKKRFDENTIVRLLSEKWWFNEPDDIQALM